METHFGLHIAKNDKFDALQDIAARLFICPRISPEHATRMLDMLVNGRLSIENFISRTDEYIAELSRQKEIGDDIPYIMNNKLDAWCKIFSTPSTKDYEYLENTFGFSQVDLFGDSAKSTNIITAPVDFENYVRLFVKGQDDVVKKLSVPLFLLYECNENNKTYRINRSIVLIGKTGSGKSYLLRKFKEICGCEIVEVNLSTTQPTGWKGRSINEIFSYEINSGRIKTKVIGNKQVVTSKILFVGDELDKITHYGCTNWGETGNAGDRDMQTELMQLLNLDTGLQIQLGVDTTTMKPIMCELPINNMLCVFAGAFDGIESIIKKRLNIGGVGFGKSVLKINTEDNLLSYVSKDDLKSWGLMDELLGRIGVISVLNPITSDVLYKIITSAKDNILQYYIEYFSKKNIEIQFEEDALRHISEMAYEHNKGVRGLDTVLYEIFSTIISNFPSRADEVEVNPSKHKVIAISKEYLAKNLNVNTR